MKISPARRVAFEILRRVEDEGAYSSALLAVVDADFDARDRALCHELVLGVLRRRLWLDTTLAHLASRPLEKLDLPVVLALRIGLYQLRFLSRIPDSAAVNESVNLVRASRLKSAAGFVNGVLRRATRERNFEPADTARDPVEKLAIQTSHPSWLLQRWISQFGLQETEALANANNEAGPLSFRLTRKALRDKGADEILAKLESSGVELRASSVTASAWRVVRSRQDSDPKEGRDQDSAESHQTSSAQLLRKMVSDGLIYFQDEGSQLVASLLEPTEGDRVLDVCAGPGGKTTSLAAAMPDGTIVAGDLFESRARLVKEFAAHQAAENVQTLVHDATLDLPFPEGCFHRVLVDAPCSGTGTLRHNPEIRWRLQPPAISELSAKQKVILRNSAATVRPSGVLVYSTCSLEQDENEAVADDFGRTHANFERVKLNAPANLSIVNQAVRTWPHRDDVDGFFVTAFRRKN